MVQEVGFSSLKTRFITAEEAAVATGGEEATVPPEAALEVVVHSLEIQDAEPIRSAR
jgi:hypothetical protein